MVVTLETKGAEEQKVVGWMQSIEDCGVHNEDVHWDSIKTKGKKAAYSTSFKHYHQTTVATKTIFPKMDCGKDPKKHLSRSFLMVQ